jgi:uncharacterized protein YfeS
MSVEWFADAYEELKQQLAIVKARLKPGEDFDCAAFHSWVEHKGQRLPRDVVELRALADGSKARRQARYAAMDEWTKLELAWEDFHPGARDLLDDPFFWSSTDDFAPNGNDIGSDVLDLFSDWRKQHRGEPSESFFNELLEEWEVDANADDSDEFSVRTFDNTSIGLAFAHLKLDGTCPEWTRVIALKSIERQVRLVQGKHPGWEQLPRRLKTFEIMASKLKGLPNKSFPADAQKDAHG